MTKIRLADGRVLLSLILSVVLAGCNLNTAVGPGGGQTSISGAPVVQIAAPPPNGTFLENVPVNIQALISNAGTDIDRIEIVVDGTTIQTLKSPNTAGAASFSIAQSWAATGDGQHTIGVTAYRADGSSSAPATVTISVVKQGAQATATPNGNTQTSSGGQNGSGGQQPQATAAPKPTNAPAQPTNTPPPAATATPSTPMATFNQGVNVRSGPSTKFNPPIGSFAAQQTTAITGVTPDGQWYKVQYYNSQGWVFGQLLTVSGDTSQIPKDPGPPVPTDTPAATATPIPTATPQTQVNLVAGNIRLDPAQPKCGQAFNIYIDVANFGSQANTNGGSISVRDTRTADGSQQGTTVGAFGVIQPGSTVAQGPIPLTVSTYYNENHTLTLVIDSGNAVAETNKGDNTATWTYKLDKGTCP